jgi:hypothetical protein
LSPFFSSTNLAVGGNPPAAAAAVQQRTGLVLHLSSTCSSRHLPSLPIPHSDLAHATLEHVLVRVSCQWAVLRAGTSRAARMYGPVGPLGPALADKRHHWQCHQRTYWIALQSSYTFGDDTISCIRGLLPQDQLWASSLAP